MITCDELKQMAITRLEDAQVLFGNSRNECAVYICGYAVEIGLKYAICKTLKWDEFPSTGGEFKMLSSFKTHDLPILLRLSGVENEIKTNLFPDWSIVVEWDPERRYSNLSTTAEQAKDMIKSSGNILDEIWKI